MPFSTRPAPTSTLLAVILAVVPLSLPSLAGDQPREGSTLGDAAAIPSSPPTFLQLRPASLPLPFPPFPASPSAASVLYTVVPGDTLWQISHAAGVSVEALAWANNIPPGEILRPGQALVVPAPGGPGATAPQPPSRTAGGIRKSAPAPSLPITAPQVTASSEHQIAAPMVQTKMLWPSSGIVTSRFGWRIHPIFGTREFHTGVDIATRWGSPVVAAFGGIVRFVGWRVGYGRLIIVDHGAGLETGYSHLSAAMVHPGVLVAPGQVIGRVGNTGWSTGPHLFFEIRHFGVPLDPTRYLH